MMKKSVAIFMLLCTAALCFSAFNPVSVAEEKAPAQTAVPSEVNLKGVNSLIILFTTSPEVIRDLIPKPLIPNEWDLIWVSISRISLGGIDFNEMIVGTPVGYRGKLFNYNIYRVVDSEAASAQGQAISGIKTPMGCIALERKDGKVKAMVERDGRVLAEAEMELGKAGEPLDALPTVFLRQIPYPPKEGVAPEVRQLVWGAMENIKVNETFDGRTVLKLDKPVRIPLDIPVLAIFRGVYRNADFTIKPKGVLYDYLKKKQTND